MKGKTKYLLLICVLLAAGAALVLNFQLIRRKKSTEKIIAKDVVYKIGSVSTDTKKGEIQFKGKILKNEGWVQHLVYLEGYKWLKDESAIISEAGLIDLQRAIAILDWKLWNKLWYGEASNQKSATSEERTFGRGSSQKLLLYVKWNEKEIPAHELVLAKDNLGLGDFVFLGSPYFDYIALGAPPGVNCRQCPLFALEEKALRELFVRETGQSGYELNPERMPSCGTEVTIIIRFPK